MFVRWDRRWRKRSADYALSAYLAKSERIGGKPRQRVVFLATIREKYLPAPAHRVIFWDTILSRLEDFDQRIGASRVGIIAAIEARVPRPDQDELQEAIKAWHSERPEWPVADLAQRYRLVLAD